MAVVRKKLQESEEEVKSLNAAIESRAAEPIAPPPPKAPTSPSSEYLKKSEMLEKKTQELLDEKARGEWTSSPASAAGVTSLSSISSHDPRGSLFSTRSTTSRDASDSAYSAAVAQLAATVVKLNQGLVTLREKNTTLLLQLVGIDA